MNVELSSWIIPSNLNNDKKPAKIPATKIGSIKGVIVSLTTSTIALNGLVFFFGASVVVSPIPNIGNNS